MKMITRFVVASALLVSVSAHALDDQGLCKTNPQAAFKVLKDMGIVGFDNDGLSQLLQQVTKMEGDQIEELVKQGAANIAEKPELRRLMATQSKMAGASLKAIQEVTKGAAKIQDQGIRLALETGLFTAMETGLKTYTKLVDALMVNVDAKMSAEAKAQSVQALRTELMNHKLTVANAMDKAEKLKSRVQGRKANEASLKILKGMLSQIEVKTCQNSFRAI